MQLIRMGSASDKDHFAVISGLKAGDKILTTANSSTRSGQTVATTAEQSGEELKSHD